MSEDSRRDFVKMMGLGIAGLYFPFNFQLREDKNQTIKPPRLREGDLIGVVSPAGPTFRKKDLKSVERSMSALGLKVKFGKHILKKHGYLAGTDTERVTDLMDMFEDPEIKGIFAMRGGWGSNRILDMLNYDLIKRNSKILIGFSDVTSLLIAIYAKTGLVTFHGPVATSKYGRFTTSWVKRILFDGDHPILKNPTTKPDGRINYVHQIKTITRGEAEGILVGGNLTVVTSMIGSEYLPDWENKILFIEEVDEKIYQLDRLFTHLKLAGILDKLSGIIIGKCIRCEPSKTTLSLSFDEMVEGHLQPLNIPAYSGAMIGHIERIFTLPIGILARMDAAKGTIKLLESAVT